MVFEVKQKGDFPLEIKVVFDQNCEIRRLSSKGGWIQPEDADQEQLKIFQAAPISLKFGDEYLLETDTKEGELRVVTYKNITQYN